MMKAASLATLWPKPASSPIAPTGIQDRSPFPPRISSLNRVPPPGWDSTPTKNGPNASAPVTSSTRLPATAHVSSPAESRAEIAPGTVHASTGIKSVTSGSGTVGAQGTAIPRPRTSHHTDLSPPHLEDYRFSRSSSLYALETATALYSSSSSATGHALMPGGAGYIVNGHNSNSTASSSSPLAPLSSDLSQTSSYYSTSPTMRKASPMPQALPISSQYSSSPSSSSPWQHTANTLTSPSTDSTPPAGKTSQVLAKLTSECDRLRREIKAEKAAKEEAVQQFQALKSRVNWLEEKKSMLSMQLDTNENALARKERRLDDLKASLEEEVARRKRAEEREAEMGRKLGETVSQAASDVSNANTARKAAENAYATLENEYSGLTRRISFLRKEVDTLTSKINENSAIHKRQVLQLEILVEQQRQAQEKSERQVMEMGELLRSYRETEENTKKLEGEMQSAVHEMRWVMRLHESRTAQAQARPQEGVNGEVRHAQKQSQLSIRTPSSPKQRRKAAPAVNGAPI